MVTIPTKPYNEFPSLAGELYEAMAKNRGEDRKYLGVSGLGRPCLRETWFDWRGFTPTPWDGRVLMIFEMGNQVEILLTKTLRLAGYQLEHAYPERQLSFEAFGGLLRGHADGVITIWIDGRQVRALLECKSANANKFEEFALRGCKSANPTYYAQVQGYMHFAGLEHCLFLVMGKDGSQIHAETIRKDPVEVARLLEIAGKILLTNDAEGKISIPDRISEDRKSQDCRWCRFSSACWDPKDAIQAKQHCRSCSFFHIGGDWKPRCSHSKHPCNLKDISLGCPDWKWIWRAPF